MNLKVGAIAESEWDAIEVRVSEEKGAEAVIFSPVFRVGLLPVLERMGYGMEVDGDAKLIKLWVLA